jgi:hypothetical protein
MTDATSTTATDHQDPAEIERDIRRTQDEMSLTVERLGDQLTPRNLMNALLDKAEDNEIDARYLIDGARRNPLALAMVAGGLIWLVSDSDAKLPKLRSGSPSGTGDFGDPHHRDYVAHMERIERREADDDLAYQRRRDLARANYFMIERSHDEDESSFRRRLDEAAERFREKRHAWADSTRQAGGSLRDAGSNAASRARGAYGSNPLIGGLLAAAAGAIAGTVLPLTRAEDERLAGVGETAREAIGEHKDQLVSAAREKKDQLLEKVEDAGRPADQGPGASSSPQAGEGQRQYANDAEEPVRQLAAEEQGEGGRPDWQGGNQQG